MKLRATVSPFTMNLDDRYRNSESLGWAGRIVDSGIVGIILQIKNCEYRQRVQSSQQQSNRMHAHPFELIEPIP